MNLGADRVLGGDVPLPRKFLIFFLMLHFACILRHLLDSSQGL